MDHIETIATSSRSAECTPVVLRETERIRLLFRPTVVQNDGQPKACIRGEFVYEKKSAKSEWEAANTESLGTIKVGEKFKLELHTAELLALVEALGPLHRSQWDAHGIRPGRQTYVKLEASLARFVGLGREALETFLDSHPQDALNVLSKLLQWVAGSADAGRTVTALSRIDADRLPSLSALLGVSALRSALLEWDSNRADTREAFWQDCLSRHAFVLSHTFAHPLVVIGERAYLGGKALDDSGGSYLDFLMASPATEAVALIEIKTPKTPLLGSAYRGGAFPPSTDLSGAIAQVMKYRRTFAADIATLARQSGRNLVFGGAPCVVILGDAESELTTADQRESFEEFRSQLRDIRIVTFDELFSRVRVSADLLEGIAVPAA